MRWRQEKHKGERLINETTLRETSKSMSKREGKCEANVREESIKETLAK